MGVSTAQHKDGDLSGFMFLVAEEKPFFRDMVQTVLVKSKAREIKHAASVEKALEVMHRFGQQISCIICDWEMAPVSGLELVRMIRSGALVRTPRDTCVVILTSRVDSNVAKSAAALDVNGIAVAPLSFEKLNKTITTALHRTIVLAPPADYAAVAVLEPPASLPERSGATTPRGVILDKKPDEASAPTAAAPKPKPHAKPGLELKNVRMRTLTDVQAGVILARDLHDKDGQLLLKLGTKLSATMLERLKDHAKGNADSYHIWVGEADTAS